MVFNDTTNKAGLIQDIEVLLGWDDGRISGDTTLLKRFTNLINQAGHLVTAWVLDASDDFQWDDTNYADFPRGTKNLVAGQRDYTLPMAAIAGSDASTFLKLIKISVLDPTGVEQVLEWTGKSEAELNAQYSVNGMPVYYKWVSNSAKVWPAPAAANVTLTNGFVCYFERSMSEFVSSDTTKQPGFPIPFHRLLSLQAALDYAAPRKIDVVPYLQTKILEVKVELQKFSANRNLDVRTRMKPKANSYD